MFEKTDSDSLKINGAGKEYFEPLEFRQVRLSGPSAGIDRSRTLPGRTVGAGHSVDGGLSSDFSLLPPLVLFSSGAAGPAVSEGKALPDRRGAAKNKVDELPLAAPVIEDFPLLPRAEMFSANFREAAAGWLGRFPAAAEPYAARKACAPGGPDLSQIAGPCQSEGLTWQGGFSPALAEKLLESFSAQFRRQVVPDRYLEKLIAQAVTLSGHVATEREIKFAKALVKQESTFDAGEINTWDRNARRGNPSKGWAQVVDSTFKRFHVPGHDDIWNPVHNLAAGIRYADWRFGRNDHEHNGLRWVAVHRSMRHLGY
jgi:hypothetical protein